MRTNEIKNEITEIKKIEEKFQRTDLKYEANEYKYDFQQFETIRSFCDSTDTGKINRGEAEMDQTNLLKNMGKFNNKSRPKTKEGKAKKQNTLNSVNALYECRELTLNAFRKGIFPIKATQGKGRPSDLATQLKILSPKQMLQRLPIALTQVKVGNTLIQIHVIQNVLNEIRQIIYSLH